MLENIVFNLIAFSIFIIIFFKIIRKNDTNYVSILILQAIGVAICFIEIKLKIRANTFFMTLRYLISIIVPIFVVILEAKGFNFSEMLTSFWANILMFFGRDKLAKKILIKMVTKYPKSYKGHRLLAILYEKEGGMRKAIDEYVKMLDIKGDDYKAYFKIADLLNELGQKNEAIEMLQNLMRNKPDSYECTILLGELLCQQSRFKEAEKVYMDALKYHPENYEIYYNLGIVYTMLNEFQMAKEMYDKAADINHKLYGAHYNLGQIALIQGDLDIAERYFKESLYEELEAKSYYQLAKIYVLKGNKETAIIFLNKAIEIEPEMLELANSEKIFEKIRQYITVSVKMETEESEHKESKKEKNENILSIEKNALEYLESTNILVRDMSENTSRLKAEKRLDEIIETQKQTEKEKDERQKELGSN